MTKNIIPDNAAIAAKRGFVRTTTQALGATLATGISAAGVTAIVTGEVSPVAAAITVGVALVSPFIAGAASYFSILSKGIPEDYQATVSPNEGEGFVARG